MEDGLERWSTAKNATLYQAQGGDWRLTTAERKRILLNNMYGVDIDSQAVEVTKLSLLLKVLEGENEESINQQLKIFHERALPDLGNNIKCGNSLIGNEFYEGEQLSLLGEEDKYRLNVFDWQMAFPEVLNGGGFNAVIGNPPYIRIQGMREWAPIEVDYYKSAYRSASSGNYDIYVVFVEKCLALLKPTGLLGFILPHKFFNAQYGEPLRSILSSGRYLSQIVHFGDQQVFSGASTYTCLMFLDKAGAEECHVTRVNDLEPWIRNGIGSSGVVTSAELVKQGWTFALGAAGKLLSKLERLPLKLEDVTDRIFQGIKTSADNIYIVEELERKGKRIRMFSRETGSEHWVESDLFHPLVKGGDSRRFHLSQTTRRILFPYAPTLQGQVEIIPEKVFEAQYPMTWKYLLSNRDYLANRENGKMQGPHWYGYVYPKALDVISLPKIFTPDIARSASMSLDETGEVFFTGGVAGGYGILTMDKVNREFILGLMNSKLLNWIVQQKATQMRGGYYSFESRFIRTLPICATDLTSPPDRNRHDHLVQMVQLMLDLNKKLTIEKTDQGKVIIDREIEVTDQQIDSLVYELYQLTEEEIAIVENASLGALAK